MPQLKPNPKTFLFFQLASPSVPGFSTITTSPRRQWRRQPTPASTSTSQHLPAPAPAAPKATIVGALWYKISDIMENYGIHHGRASRTWENSKQSTMGKDKTNPSKPYYMFETMGLDEGELSQTCIPWKNEGDSNQA